MSQPSGRNSAPLVPIRPPPPPPVTSASGNKQQQDVASASSSKKSGMNLSKLLPKRMLKQTALPSSSSGVKKAVPPPRPPPPKIAPKQPVLIDLLSGSPPSSPSPTLRSQESGFEESPDVWRSWPDSSTSTPQVDWNVGPSITNSSVNQPSDPWDVKWPTSTTAPSGWADFGESPQEQRQLSEVRSTTMPVISNTTQSTTNSTFYAPAAAGVVPQTVRSAPSMPTIIRPGPNKKVVKTVVEPVVEDDLNVSFHLPMPSFPPPELPQVVEDVSSAPTNFLVVAIYDYESDHPEDLYFKAGDVIEVLSAVNEDWYTGQCGDRVGHFPSNFVEPQ